MKSFGLQSNVSRALLGAGLVAVIQMPAVFGLESVELNKLAQGFTVRLSSQSPGSGVIIQRDRSTYTVLTAAHVVETDDDYEIIAPDGLSFPVVHDSIQKIPGLDLALVEFVTERTYNVAKIGDSTDIQGGEPLFIVGFPTKSAAITESIYNFTEGKVTAVSNKSLLDGYGLIYTNRTLPGMSGGAILNQSGQLVGIHGRADTTNEPQNQSLNEAIYIKTGFNLGIPTNQFLMALQQLDSSLDFREPVSPTETAESKAFDLYLTGLSQIDESAFAEAVQSLSEALELKFDFPEARLARAHAFIMSAVLGNEDYDRSTGTAIRDCTRAIQLQPQQASGYYCRGNAQTYALEYESAIADFDRAILLEPNNAMAYYKRGYGLYLSRKSTQAIADLARAIELNPDFEAAYAIRASILEASEPQNAIADYGRAIQLNPTNVNYYLSRGELNLAVGHHAEAVQDFSMFIRKKPDSHLGYAQRGLALVKNGQSKQALEDFNRSISLIPDSVQSIKGYSYALPYYGRGLAYAQSGQRSLAIQDLQSAINGFEAVLGDPPPSEYLSSLQLMKELQSK